MNVRTLLPVTLLCLTSFACKDDDKKVIDPPIDHYLPATSIANVLDNLVRSYEEMNIEKYRALFAEDEFFFEFAQVDRDRDPTIPTGWDFPTDQVSTENMFEDDTIDKIVLDFTKLAPVEATTGDQFPGGPNGVWKATVQSVHLEVHTVGEDNQPLEFLVDGDGADFFFREYPDEPVNGLPSWKIVRWRDKPVGGIARPTTPTTEKTTWGSIKGLYN